MSQEGMLKLQSSVPVNVTLSEIESLQIQSSHEGAP